MAGIAVAAGAVEHQYFVTEKKLDLPRTLPTLRDPDRLFYLKPDVGAFAIGGWEANTRPLWRAGVPFDFARELFPANMERLEQFALPAAERLPVLNDIGIQTIINGPIPVSADGEPVMGLAPELDNLFVACGFTAGIAASGGAGEAMASWIVAWRPGHGSLGRSTSAGSGHRRPTAGSWKRGWSRPMAAIMRCIGRERRCTAPVPPGAVRCTIGWRRAARCSAAVSAGNGRCSSAIGLPTGRHWTDSRSGSTSSAPSIGPCASGWRSSTRPPSPSSR